MTTTEGAMQQVMMDATVDTALTMTAQMLGLPKETVTTIVQVGLPILASMAEENPELLKSLYTQSLQLMPEPVQQFYAKVAENPAAQQQLVDEFKAAVGPMTESLNRQAARQAGVTEAQAERVLATTYPAVAETMSKANTEQTQVGFAQRLKNLISR
jgi:hypothetical protein